MIVRKSKGFFLRFNKIFIVYLSLDSGSGCIFCDAPKPGVSR